MFGASLWLDAEPTIGINVAARASNPVRCNVVAIKFPLNGEFQRGGSTARHLVWMQFSCVCLRKSTRCIRCVSRCVQAQGNGEIIMRPVKSRLIAGAAS